MKNYSLDKYDFKNYLLEKLVDTRQEELIFWKKTIPMPIDVLYNIFEKRGDLLNLYLQHLGAACLFKFAIDKEGGDGSSALAGQPTGKNKLEYIARLELLKRHFSESNVAIMLNELANYLMLKNFIVDEKSLTNALCHEGRKYKRIYVPSQFRTIVVQFFPEIFTQIAISNGDMFSNVVADELNIYRMGFGDAFTGIFNKLLDFIIENSMPGNVSYANASDLKLIFLKDDNTQSLDISYGRVIDGSLWELFYKNSKTSIILNSIHPFIDLAKKQKITQEEILKDVLEALAEIEIETLRDADLKVIENMRQDFSRKLRIMAEKKHL